MKGFDFHCSRRTVPSFNPECDDYIRILCGRVEELKEENRRLSANQKMRITVIGLWHLGCVTAACMAKRFKVIGLECASPTNLDFLRANMAPLAEPGLSSLMAERRKAGMLTWTSALEHTISCDTDILWVCHDVGVREDGTSDYAECLSAIRRCANYLPPDSLIVLSAQLPVGTARSLNQEFPDVRFAVIPENLRIGSAIKSFSEPARIIVGLRPEDEKSLGQIGDLLFGFPGDVIRMHPESAEMTKHALNGFLAMSVAYANEIGRICPTVGANAGEVARGMMSDARVGPKAYLNPGAPFTGWTLVRDLSTLCRVGSKAELGLTLIPAIRPSNDEHAERTGIVVKYGRD